MNTVSCTILTVVLNFRTPDMTADAVDAALFETRGFAGHLVVVDNDSGDGSIERLRCAAQERGWGDCVSVVPSGANNGFGAGNNFGMRYGLAHLGDVLPDYVYILNSDAFPDEGAVHALVAALDQHPNVGIAGSYIHGPDGDPHITAFRFPSIGGEFEGAARIGPISKLLASHIVPMPMPTATKEVDWLAGASMLIRRDVLEAIDMFDETFFLYFEETDLCLRARRAGWKTLYVCESKVTHIGSVSTGMKTWTRMPSYWFDSRKYYFSMNHGGIYAALATGAHMTGACLWRIWRILFRKPRRDPDHFLKDLIVHDFRWHAPDIRHVVNFMPLSKPPQEGDHG